MNQEEIMQQLQVGMQALQSGSLDAAENLFRSILSVNSSEVHSLHFLGVVFCQKGKLDDGMALIEQSIRLDPSRFGPYLNMGRFLVGANQWDRAVAALEQAIQRDASSFDAWSMLAQASFFSGNAAAALKAGKKAAEINPGNAEIFFSLGVYATETNKDKAIDHYRNAVSLDPTSFKAWVNLGNCLLDCQHVEDAIDAFNEALKADPSCFQALMGLSRAYGDLNQWVESLATAQQALLLDPLSHDAAFWVGYSLHKLERKQDAVNAYRAALNISPVAAQTHLYLASALEGLGEDQEALNHYELATKVDPKLSLAFTYWGALLQKGGDVSLAIDKYRRAVETDPLSAEAYLGLGTALHEDGGIDEAIASYRKAIEVKPDFGEAYLNLGIVLKEDGEVEEAIASYRKAIELKPDSADALSALAQCLMNAGRVSESLGAYENCSRLNPWDPSNYELPARDCDSCGDLLLSRLAVDLYAKSFQIRPPVSGFVFDGQASVVSLPRIDTIAQSLPENAELLPSFTSFDAERGLSLYYLHIPKNGGIRFTVPLQESIRLYENSLFDGKFDGWRDAISLHHSYKRLTALRLNNKSLHDAFLESLSSSEPDHNIDWSLVMSHGSWSSLELQQRIADVTGKTPIRVGAWREPRERFLSALHYLYREAGGSLERVIKDLSDKKPFLHNAIYRYASDCVDGDLIAPQRESTLDYLLEIGDHSVLNQLQSSFLTRNGLPNLIVSKRFNITKGDYRMSADDEARLLEEFHIDDFVCMDESDAVNSLRTSELPAELSCSPSGDELHPLTVIVSDSTKQISSGCESEICLTADLAGDRGRQKLQRIFAGKNI